jgi:transposase
MAKDTMGIDVSKDRLGAFWHSQEEACSVANTAEGFEQPCAWMGRNDDFLIVFEATGAYDRGLERHLMSGGPSLHQGKS